MFDFVVDSGSSLGLWIGLSALGLYDFVHDMIYWIVQKYKTMKK